MPFVLDNSVVTGWYLVDQSNDYKLSSYDAVYLELAMRHGLSIATLDAQLKRAAAAAGVDVAN